MIKTCISCNTPSCKLYIFINNYVVNKNELFIIIPDFCKNYKEDNDYIRKF